jgi:hypothetical protein
MNIELSGPEGELLRDVLLEHMSSMRQQVYHAEAHTFKDQLKERQRVLQGLISKLPH